jgi:hypothetical protein
MIRPAFGKKGALSCRYDRSFKSERMVSHHGDRKFQLIVSSRHGIEGDTLPSAVCPR